MFNRDSLTSAFNCWPANIDCKGWLHLLSRFHARMCIVDWTERKGRFSNAAMLLLYVPQIVTQTEVGERVVSRSKCKGCLLCYRITSSRVRHVAVTGSKLKKKRADLGVSSIAIILVQNFVNSSKFFGRFNGSTVTHSLREVKKIWIIQEMAQNFRCLKGHM
jgi:Pyruvate/2-oxoacid:ferredoxin oxidoreductase delta subunit